MADRSGHDEIAVAPFVPRDRDAVVELVLGIQRGELGVPITLPDQPDLADVPAFYQRGRGGFWVARAGEQVVGTIGLLDGGGEVALRKMFVHRAYRGRERGDGESAQSAARSAPVSYLLLEALLAHARAKGVGQVFLGTRPEMRAAHRFYEKHGFTRLEERELPPSFPRMTFDSVFYRRTILSAPR